MDRLPSFGPASGVNIARMKYGAHLPLIDFAGDGYGQSELDSYTDAARDLGFEGLASNDHFVFQKPWIDGLVALSSIIGRSGDMMLATTISLPVVRGPVALAKAAAAIDILSGGRLVLGVGPGSSARDYELAGIDFQERWPRLDEAIRVLRAYFKRDAPAFEGRFYNSNVPLEPRPERADGPPIWIGSWGSDAGLRRVARLADGWLASAYNTTPREIQNACRNLHAEMQKRGRDPSGFPCSLATMWTYITRDGGQRNRRIEDMARMLNRPPGALREQLLIGTPEECAARLRAYSEAGVHRVFIWPLEDGTQQLELFMKDVAPLLEDASAR
jgi:alkanesulfonate monooxygenase SsuD/methylene tetrahydromethanopterin reductase-like flavin-dependent oxidoreductase (luciferase family)